MKDKIIVACDVSSKDDFIHLARKLQKSASFIKIGMECFYSLGNESVTIAKDFGYKVFLDLKLHDIPNTVERSCRSLSRLGVDILNVHALGGLEMMKAAKQGIQTGTNSPLLIGVTHLTSLNQTSLNGELGIKKEILQSTIDLALLTKKAGLDGVVSSAHEVKEIKKACGSDFLAITPGIRLGTENQHDQKRVMNPAEAFSEGSDYLVIGRSITNSDNPDKIFNKIAQELL